jgi:hypothetical protein
MAYRSRLDYPRRVGCGRARGPRLTSVAPHRFPPANPSRHVPWPLTRLVTPYDVRPYSSHSFSKNAGVQPHLRCEESAESRAHSGPMRPHLEEQLASSRVHLSRLWRLPQRLNGASAPRPRNPAPCMEPQYQIPGSLAPCDNAVFHPSNRVICDGILPSNSLQSLYICAMRGFVPRLVNAQRGAFLLCPACRKSYITWNWASAGPGQRSSLRAHVANWAVKCP